MSQNENEEWESTKGSGDVWNPTVDENGDSRPVGYEGTVDDVLDGYYKDIKHNVGPNSSEMYVIEQKDGTILNVWGSKALNDEMAKIRIGQFIRLKYLGKQLTKGGALKPANKRGSTDSFHNWEIFQSKTVPAKNYGTANSTNTATASPAADAKSNGGAGIVKQNNAATQEDDLPF